MDKMKQFEIKLLLNSIEEAKEKTERALDVTLDLHNSMHYGGDYYASRDGVRKWMVFQNRDFEDEPIVNDPDTEAIILYCWLEDTDQDPTELLRKEGIGFELISFWQG